MSINAATLSERIKSLSSEQIIEVEHFVEFLQFRDENQGLTGAAAIASQPTFEAVWNNPEDAAYDGL